MSIRPLTIDDIGHAVDNLILPIKPCLLVGWASQSDSPLSYIQYPLSLLCRMLDEQLRPNISLHDGVNVV